MARRSRCRCRSVRCICPPAGFERRKYRNRRDSAADAFVEEASSWSSRQPAATVGGELDAAALGDSTIAFDASVRIVLADDNADMRSYLTGILSQRWTVTLAADGEEALALARELAPDLVVTDVMMPRLDGFGLLRELRRDEATRTIPVMMLSARAGEESRIEGFQAGADDYLVKPFSARELLARVEAQLLRVRLRRAEEATARRIATIFAQAPVAIAIMRGPDHVFEMANDAYLTLVARPVIGQSVADAFPEVVSQGIIELLDDVRATGRPYVGRALPLTLNRGVNGAPEQCFLDFVYQPLVDHAGAIDGICAVVYEVTDLVTARETAESANRTKDEFLAMLGHELRNPLAPILTALQLLRLRGVEGGDRERTIIERQVRHLVGLVDDLLDVSRITRGKVRLDPQPIELNAVVAKAIELASPLLEQHQHILETDVPRTGLGVMADAARLAQVVEQPADQRRQIHAARWPYPYQQPIGRRGGDPHRPGQRHRHRRRDAAARVRSVHPGSPGARSRPGRSRSRVWRSSAVSWRCTADRSVPTATASAAAANSPSGCRGSSWRRRRLKTSLVANNVRRSLRAVFASWWWTTTRMRRKRWPMRWRLRATRRRSRPMGRQRCAPRSNSSHTWRCSTSACRSWTDSSWLAISSRSRIAPTRTRLVAVTGYGQEHDRQRSAAAGFDDHLVKPVDIDQVNQLIQRLVESSARDSPLD